MAKKVKVLMGGREKMIDGKVAEVLVRIGKAKYIPVTKKETYQTRMMVAETSVIDPPTVQPLVYEDVSSGSREELKRILDAAGVDYDGRLGEAKLRELVESLDKE